MLRILLVDDDRIIRQGLKMLLELRRNLLVIGEAEDGETALTLAQTLRPDLVIMESALPQLDGITVATRMRAGSCQCAVVMLSLKDDVETRTRALAAGANAFVGKHETPNRLLEAVQQAYRGEIKQIPTDGNKGGA